MTRANPWLLTAALPLILCIGMQWTSCSQPAREQARRQRDSIAAVEEILALEHRAAIAERELIAVAKADSTHRWVHHEFGWWYTYTHRSDEHVEYTGYTALRDTCFLIHERVCTMDGVLLVDAVRECCTPRRNDGEDELLAYKFMLCEMVPEDTVELLVPWSKAYGAQGKGHVPPYTNLRIYLTLHTNPMKDAEQTNATANN